MRITRKKSSPIRPQSPPQEMCQMPKNKKDGKEQASKIISPGSISMHIKRAVEGITSKIEKKSIEKIIIDSETEEGCEYLINSFIDEFERNSNSDSIMLKSLEVIYVLLNTSNSTFRTKMKYIMPEILTITTLNFKKPEVKYRNSVQMLAKAIYLNLQRNVPFPSPTKLGLIEDFSQFISSNIEYNNLNSRIRENKSSFEYEYENDNEFLANNNNDNQKTTSNDIIDDLINTSTQQENLSNTNYNINKIPENEKNSHITSDQNNIDIDLIDCEDADNKSSDDSNNSIKKQPTVQTDNLNHPISKAKQAFDDYLSKNGQDDNKPTTSQNDLDNLLLMPDDSYRTSSNAIYSSADVSNADKSQVKVDVITSANNSQNIMENLFDNKASGDNDFYFEADPSLVHKTKPHKKNFNISKGKNEKTASPNIPRSQSLQNRMPLVLNQVPSSHLNPDSLNSNIEGSIDSNQIIDLTKPASTPNSPTNSLVNLTQSSYLDSILNSQPATSPSQNYNSSTAVNSPSTFNPPSNFNSPDSTSNYNSETASNFELNSNQYSSQLSKSNSIINSNLVLGLDSTLNSVSDSILKIPSKELIATSKSSEIQTINSPSKLKSNIHLDPSNSTCSLNETSDSSSTLHLNGNDNQYASNIHLNPNQEKRKRNSSRFNVKIESSSKSQKDENSTSNLTQPKTKTAFKIEKKSTSSSSPSGNSETIKVNQLENPIDSSFNYSQNQDSLINGSNNYSTATVTTTSNNFSSQDLFNSSVQTSNNDDNFQVGKQVFNLDDFDDQFEPITPIHSQNIQVFNDPSPKPITSPSSSIAPTNEESSSTENDQFVPVTPVRKPVTPQKSDSINDPLIQFTPIRSTNLTVNNDVSNDNNTNNTNNINNYNDDAIFGNNNDVNVNVNHRNGTESDDQFVPITPVRNSIGFEDDLFAKSKSEGGVASFSSDQFVPITPVKEQLSNSDDQFVPITPVKNSLDRIFDDDEVLNNINSNVNNNNGNGNKNGMFEQFVPISPSMEETFLDNQGQNKGNINGNNKLYGQFIPFEKSDNSQDQEAGPQSNISDQFVPISPVAESIIPILSNPSDETNRNRLPSIMRGGKNNFNNFMMSASSRGRHLSFDSGLLSPSGNDKFEAITPPNAKSMFYPNRFDFEQRALHVSKSDSEDGAIIRNENSMTDQFEPITPPSSLKGRSQIEDLIQSSNNDVVQNDAIFNQNNEENKFDENLDKKLNTKNQKTGSHHLVSFEITKQNKNQQQPQNDFNNFDFNSTQISKSINESTNLGMSFESFGAGNYSKSQEHFKNDTNNPPINMRETIPNNNQSNRFRMSYIKRNASPQKFNGDNNNFSQE